MGVQYESIDDQTLTRYVDFTYGNWPGKVWQHAGRIHARLDDNPVVIRKIPTIFLERQAYRLWFRSGGIVESDTLIDKLEVAYEALLR